MNARMSWALFAGLAVALGPVPAASQVAVSVSAGPTFSTFFGSDVDGDDLESRTGFFVGAGVGIPLGGALGLGTGLYYAQKGADDTAEDGSGAINLDYLEVPVLLQIQVTEPESAVGFSLMAGPTIGIEVGCDIPNDQELCDDVSSLDVGVAFGGGLSFDLTESVAFGVNGGVDIGLRSIDSTEFGADDVKNRSIFLAGGVSWVVGG